MLKLTFTNIAPGIWLNRAIEGAVSYGAFTITRSPFRADSDKPWRLKFQSVSLCFSSERVEKFATMGEARARANELANGTPV